MVAQRIGVTRHAAPIAVIARPSQKDLGGLPETFAGSLPASSPALATLAARLRLAARPVVHSLHRLTRPVFASISILFRPLKLAAAGVVIGALLVAPGTASAKNDLPAPVTTSVLESFGVRGPKLEPAIAVKDLVKPTGFEYPSLDPTKSSTVVELVPFAGYDPKVASTEIEVDDPRVMRWLRSDDLGETRNLEHTDFAALEAHVTKKLAANPAALRTLGIAELDHLTPKQAVLLASWLTIEELAYDYGSLGYEPLAHPNPQGALARIEARDPILHGRILAALPKDIPASVGQADYAGVDALFAGPDGAPNAVCRNYVESFQAVFRILARLQDPSRTLLANTYVKTPHGDRHIWPAVYTIQPDRTLSVTQVDPTWADTNGANSRTLEGRLDYTNARAHYLAEDLHFGANGVSPSKILEDFWLTYFLAVDQAARGDAKAGARLIMDQLDLLPEITKKAMLVWAQNLADKPWRMSGATELGVELAKALSSSGAPGR
jgi:hypothetical protein